jgi:membrane protease subunit HflK
MSSEDPQPVPHSHPASPSGGPPGPLEDAGTQALAEALRSSFNIVRLLMAVLLVSFVASGVYTVAPNQEAVLLRFGKPVGVGQQQRLQPGLHWKLPYPIDEVVYIPVGETRTLTSSAGWYAVTPEEELAGGKAPESANPFLTPGLDGYTLTGDGNIVHVRATVNYRISDPLRYEFEFAQTTNLLQHLLDNALFYAAAGFNADDALYGARRAAFREAVVRRFSESVDRLQIGVSIDPREVRVDPPLYVQRAFTDVLEAQNRGDIKVREAEAYARGATNKAVGEASVVFQNGLTMSNALVQAVATDATNFSGLLPAWERNPRLLRERLLADSVQRVLTNAQLKAILVEGAGPHAREIRIQLSKDIEAPTRIDTSTQP